METLIESVKRNEGLRLFPYKDTSGKLTIGWGRNLDACGITLPEAEKMLKTDIARAVDGFYHLPFEVTRNCNVARRRVLCEMIFNMGLNGVLGFKKMLSAIEIKDFEGAGDQIIDSQMAKQTGARAQLMAQAMREG